MTAKERIARESRRAREAPPEAPSELPGATVEDPTIEEPTIEFEDRSDEDYRAAVLEVMAALDWVRQQRGLGHLPN